MTENEMINGWTFEETIKITENLMEKESNMFIWDVLRHLRDFAENYKDEIQSYRAIGTIEEFKALKEKSEPKKILKKCENVYKCPICNHWVGFRYVHCDWCGQKLDWSE